MSVNSQVVRVVLVKDSISPTLLVSEACIIPEDQSQSKPGSFYLYIMDTSNISVCWYNVVWHIRHGLTAGDVKYNNSQK